MKNTDGYKYMVDVFGQDRVDELETQGNIELHPEHGFLFNLTALTEKEKQDYMDLNPLTKEQLDEVELKLDDNHEEAQADVQPSKNYRKSSR